ncbi:MAG: hypothetical protein KDA25_01155, partial [Phycisphaerales bacterium]|nr:hypothetical protein [Phycisphaerales bacterium]
PYDSNGCTPEGSPMPLPHRSRLGVLDAACVAVPVATLVAILPLGVTSAAFPSPANASGSDAASSTESPPRAAVPDSWRRIVESRHPAADGPVVLGYRDTKIEDILPFVAEATGKTLTCRLVQIAPTKITLTSSRPMSRNEALDRLYEAFAKSGIGVAENESTVALDLLTEHASMPIAGVVVGPDESVEGIDCGGIWATAVIDCGDLDEGTAIAVAQSVLPPNGIPPIVSAEGTIVVSATVAWLQRVDRVLRAATGRPRLLPAKGPASAPAADPDDGARATILESPTTTSGTTSGMASRPQWRGRRTPADLPPPLTEEAIAAMTHAQRIDALQAVAAARLTPNLSEDEANRLKDEFDRLLDVLRTARQ